MRAFDQAGFRAAIAAYLVDPADPSIDSIPPQLLKFKLMDSMRKAVRSFRLTRFFKRDAALGAGAIEQFNPAARARSKQYAGRHAEEMASVLKDVHKSRAVRAPAHHAPLAGRFEVRV